MKGPWRRLLVVLLLTSGTAQAQGTKPTANPTARAHFQEGLSSAQRGELEAALRQFRAAYQLQPHFSVLYNIGQAETTLGHPIQAVAAFERYLKDGAEQVRAERKDSVLELIATNKRLIGQLRVVVAEPDRTRVWLDGAELKREQLSESIPVKTGEHTLMHASGTTFPVSQLVTISSTGVAEVRIGPPVEATSGSGQLAVSCDVPGVTVDISGGPRLVTPVKDPIVVPAGALTLRFTRAGYEPAERSILIAAQRLARIDCAQRALPKLSPELRASLRVRAHPAGAETFVDGERFLGAPLPAGPHTLRVEHDGYTPLHTTLSLSAGQTRVHDAVLKPTPARADALAQARSRRRTFAYVIGGASAALLVTSGSMLLWNNQRYKKFDEGKATATPSRNLDFATSIQRVDDLSLGLLITGVIGGAASIWTFYSNDSE